jgi:hypothetical protein
LSAAQRLGTASMKLGYCYMRGHGVSADKTEALRLFRLTVEQAKEKVRLEVERLAESLRGSTMRSCAGFGLWMKRSQASTLDWLGPLKFRRNLSFPSEATVYGAVEWTRGDYRYSGQDAKLLSK